MSAPHLSAAFLQEAQRPLNVGLGQMAIAGSDESLVIYGLGSCIGLVLWSRLKQVGSLSHIVMPNSRGVSFQPANPAKYVDWAVPEAIEALARLGVRREELVAKLAGGAHTLGGALGTGIGSQNAQATLALLREQRVRVLAQHIGGTVGRTIRFGPDTGRVEVRTVGGDWEEL